MTEHPTNSDPQVFREARLSGLAVATLAVALLLLVFGFRLTLYVMPVAVIVVIIMGHLARAQIRRSNGTIMGGGIALAGLVLGYLLLVLLPVAYILQESGSPRLRTVDASNLRQIGQASLIYANDHRDRLPGVYFEDPDGEERLATIHDVAFMLARHGGINDGSMWLSRSDHAAADRDSIHTVLNEERTGLHPDFAALEALSFDYATGLDMEDPPDTPIAWTRGLREDGTWDRHGVYRRDGGHIVFLDGNVRFFRDLTGDDRLERPDGTKTSNILETLPPGARVVGAGPASLDGSESLNEGEQEQD